jgi:hypothetical protein
MLLTRWVNWSEEPRITSETNSYRAYHMFSLYTAAEVRFSRCLSTTSWSAGIVPHILVQRIQWYWVVISFTPGCFTLGIKPPPPRGHPLETRLGGSRTVWKLCGRKEYLPVPGVEPGILVTVTYVPSRFSKPVVFSLEYAYPRGYAKTS